MRVRDPDSVKELKIHARSEAGPDSTQCVVELKRSVDRRSGEVKRRLRGNDEFGYDEDREKREPSDERRDAAP